MTGDPQVSEEQLAALADTLFARLLPQLEMFTEGKVAILTADSLELSTVDVEGMLACSASPEFVNVIAALWEARKEFGALKRNQNNPHFKSSYADLAAVFSATDEGLSNAGLVLVQSPIYLKWKGDLEMFIQTRLLHVKTGEWLQAWWLVDPRERTPQGFGSAITYGKRYPAQALLGLASEDDDGNAATGRSRQERRQDHEEQAPTGPPVEITDEERAAIADTIASQTTVEGVREFWSKLGSDGKLTQGFKALLNTRASEITKAEAAKAKAEAESQAEAPPQAATPPTDPEPEPEKPARGQKGKAEATTEPPTSDS